MAGVLNVDVGSRSRIALSLGGSHSQKKFKFQSNPPLRYVDTGSKLKSENQSRFIKSMLNNAKNKITKKHFDKNIYHVPLKLMFSITGHTNLFGLSFILSRRGSSHPGSTSQWLSRNKSTSPVASLLALTRDLINPSLLSFLISLTFCSF